MSAKSKPKVSKAPAPTTGVLPPPKFGGGDPDGDAIFLQVGRALDAWEHLEEILADMFAVLTGEELAQTVPGPTPGGTFVYAPKSAFSPARRAYGAIATFRARKEMLLAAGEAYFLNRSEKGPYVELKSLLNKCTDLSARRNEIAHGVVNQYSFTSMGSSTAPPGFQWPDDNTWYLMPALYNSIKIVPLPERSSYPVAPGQSYNDALRIHLIAMLERGPGKYKYNSSQVNLYREQFVSLYHEAVAYRDKLAERAG